MCAHAVRTFPLNTRDYLLFCACQAWDSNLSCSGITSLLDRPISVTIPRSTIRCPKFCRSYMRESEHSMKYGRRKPKTVFGLSACSHLSGNPAIQSIYAETRKFSFTNNICSSGIKAHTGQLRGSRTWVWCLAGDLALPAVTEHNLGSYNLMANNWSSPQTLPGVDRDSFNRSPNCVDVIKPRPSSTTATLWQKKICSMIRDSSFPSWLRKSPTRCFRILLLLLRFDICEEDRCETRLAGLEYRKLSILE